MRFPEDVKKYLGVFLDNGHSAYVVGGAVRDSLCGEEPYDYDVATDARAEEMKALFPAKDVFETGIKHGTLSIRFCGRIYETTTFRMDGEYLDYRRPESVSFTDDLKADLSRRDFTVNAIAADVNGDLIDPFGGEEDIKRGLIRAVGDPENRFNEDALRILRAVRFAAATGFTIESGTYSAMLEKKSLLSRVSKERIYQETTKLLLKKNASFALEKYKDIIFEIIPELKASDNFDQKNPAHFADVYTHTLYALNILERKTPVTVWATLLHDIGKPFTFVTDERGCGHFPGHMSVSADIANKILSELRTPNDLRRRVCTIIRFHDEPMLGKYAVKKFLNAYDDSLLEDLIAVKFADIYAHSEIGIKRYLEERVLLKKNYEEIKYNSECYRLSDLNIDGNDLIKEGYSPRSLGVILDDALDAVMRGEVENDKENLIYYVTEKYGKN